MRNDAGIIDALSAVIIFIFNTRPPALVRKLFNQQRLRKSTTENNDSAIERSTYLIDKQPLVFLHVCATV